MNIIATPKSKFEKTVKKFAVSPLKRFEMCPCFALSLGHTQAFPVNHKHTLTV